MTTFLWMLYLAFTILISMDVIFGQIQRFIAQISITKYDGTLRVIAAILWSIWYFYCLN